MCWSLEVSVFTGLASYCVAFYIWLRNIGNDRWNSMLLFVVASIQWMDAIIWYADKIKKLDASFVRITLHYLIPLILSLEPVASLYGASYMGNQIDTYDIVIYSCMFLFLLVTLSGGASVTNVIQSNGIKYNQTTYNDFFYWLFCFLLIYPLIKYTNFDKFYLLVSAVICLALYLAKNKTNALGSNWCLYGNAISVLFLFYPYITSYLQK